MFARGVIGIFAVFSCFMSVGFCQIEDPSQNNVFYRRQFACPPDWIQRCNRCYLYVDEDRRWTDAQAYCRSLGGDLVTIRNFRTLLFATRIARYFGRWSRWHRTFWIGANDRRVEDQFEWSDGTPASRWSFYFFRRGQPDDAYPGEDCVEMYSRGRGISLWNDNHCDDEQPFMCQMTACTRGQFRCANGKCVTKYAVCDRVNDCGDNSDEMDCKHCGGKLEGTSGNFSSPNYPMSYPNDADCSWLITVPLKNKIELTLDTLQLEVRFDFIYVYDGPSTKSKLLARITGWRKPTPITSSGPQLFVRFTSDYSYVMKGFFARFKAIPESCGSSLSLSPGQTREIMSPRYPQMYPPSAKCMWKISTSPGTELSIKFIDFETEPVNDFVDVRDGNAETSQLIAKLSGSRRGPFYVTTGPNLFVKFSSDAAIVRRGFKALIRADCYIELNSSYGVITSPGFGYSKYPDNLRCMWVISEPNNRSVALMFHYFATEKYFDTVDVEKGPGKVLAGRYSGTLDPWTLDVGSDIRIKFRTDYSASAAGFNLTFSIGCPALENPSNGYLSTMKTHYGVTVWYKCNYGYKLMNGMSKTCMFRGIWTPKTPRCQEIICGPSGEITNGWRVVEGGYKYNSNVTYYCLGGYQLNGTKVRRCQKDGTWSGVLPTCLNVGCGDPGTPANGRRMSNDTKVGATIQFSCKLGYKMIGGDKITCGADGKWSAPIPTCDPIFCAVPPPPNNGKIVTAANMSIPVKIRFGEMIHYACNTGFRLSGSQTVVCQANSRLNDTVPTCPDLNECNDSPCKGSGAICRNLIGSYKCYCMRGYQMTSPNTCQDIDECKNNNGLCSQNCTNLPGTYQCSCREGYYLYTEKDGIIPESIVNHTCLGVKCPTPPALIGGGRVGSILRYPNYMETLCNVGYIRTNGPKMIQCMKNGTWNGEIANCSAVRCADPGMIAYGTRNITGYGFKDTVTYECMPGYFMISGSSERECISNETHSYWTGSAPVCERKDCGKQAVVPFGKYMYQNGTLYGDKLIYGCISGYDYSGNNMSVCQANGQWSNRPGFCAAQSCPDPGIPKNGERTGTLLVDQTVTYSCILGYSLRGNNNRTCKYLNETHKIWTGQLPECRDMIPPSFGSTCPNDTSVTMALKETYAFASWVIPIATDNSGKNPHIRVEPNVSPPAKLPGGANLIVYRATDDHGNEGNCTFTVTVIDLEPPTTFCPKGLNITADMPVNVYYENGYATDNTAISHFIFDPPNGTRFLSESRNKVIMTAVDTSGNNASCFFEVVVKGCGCPDYSTCNIVPKNGSASCHVVSPPISCNVACDSGLAFADRNFTNTFLHCPHHRWTKQVPYCAKKNPDIVTGCNRIKMTLYFNDQPGQTLSLRELYTKFERAVNFITASQEAKTYCSMWREGLSATEETINGKKVLWREYKFFVGAKTSVISREAVYKRFIDCANVYFSHVKNNQSHIRYLVGNYSEAIHDPVLNVTTVPTTTCCPGTQGLCCTSPRTVLGEGATGADTGCYVCTPGTFYNSATENCEGCGPHYYQDEYNQTSCKPCPAGTDTFDTYPTKCIEKCKNGTFSLDGFTPICRQCPVGQYQPSIGATDCIACPAGTTTRGTGASGIDECIAPCSAGQNSSDGLPPCENCPLGTYQPNTGRVICLPCPDGGKFGGQAGAVNASQCPGNDSCYAAPCKNNGTCIRGELTYTCDCPAGFAGRHCEINIDECASNPCRNNGTCYDKVNGYNCSCVAGFTDPICGTNINDCAQQCQNGGTCIDGINSFTCKCQPGFAGNLCHKDINECIPNPCHNNATCIDLVNNYHCICLAGYTGRNCSENINECLPNPCKNGGTCTDLVNAYQCHCALGYEGKNCEINIDDCKSAPCANGGICVDMVNDYSCNCLPGYTGKNCSVNINECAVNPCMNNASCTDKVNDFACVCLAGYTGKRCEIDIDECASNPCLNKGTCFDKINGYSCVCAVGYEGLRCENETNECASNPCVNGTCADLLADYRCDCTPGFTGRNCETDINECSPNPCKNKGNCTDMINAYRCTCPIGFTGINCETNIDDCKPDPCNGNAVNCTDLVNGFLCGCKPGYRGSRCEIEIDFCQPNPCQHNSSCTSITNDASFKCNCSLGYRGRTCEIEIDECMSKPCKNGGTCNNMVGYYTCTCPTGFTGTHCGTNIDDCVMVNQTKPCLNGGVCLDQINSYKCSCPITHTGNRCEKAKSLKFDLNFAGGAGSYVRYANLTSDNATSVSVWVRFPSSTSKGVFLSLANVINASSYDVMLTISHSLVRIYTTGNPMTYAFRKDINDGLWHHVAVTMENVGGKIEVYQDTVLEHSQTVAALVGKSFFDPIGALLLGEEITATVPYSASHTFIGEMSQLGVWNRVITADERASLTANCSTNLTDTMISWLHIAALKGPRVTQIEPTSCGKNVCPPAFTGQFCETEIDKIPPTIVYCPNATKIVSPNRITTLSFTEPSFTDNKVIARITKSHRPGQPVTWGDYIVTYVAEDQFGNSATCTFELFVTRYDCQILKPPINGAKICGSWEKGRYCDAKCYPGFQFSVRVAPYYSCTQGGYWSHGPPFYPSNVNNLLPACSSTQPSSVSTTNQVSYASPSCDAAFIQAFRAEFIKKINAIQTYWPICGVSCDFTNIGIKCSTPARKRRSTGGAQSTIVVTIPVNGTDTQNYTQQVDSGIKNLQINLTVTVNNVTLNSTDNKVTPSTVTSCPKGSVLESKNTTCVLCAVGTFHNETDNTCVECPIGSYQNKSGSSNCTSCPSSSTTAGSGSVNLTSCISQCNSGSFFNVSSNKCQLCSAGFYQNATGQIECLACPLEKSSNIGAKSLEECFEKCGLGSELVPGDACQLCPKATYRDMLNQTGCMPCPYKTTTYLIGAKTESACKAECSAGYEVTTDGKSCMECQTGTFRSTLTSPYCFSCPSGGTTNVTGATSSAECIALTDTITENVQLRFVNEVWTDKLNDENSTEFRALASKVSKAIAKVYASEPGLKSVKVKQLKNGSVIATVDMIFNKLTQNRLSLLTNAVTSGFIDTLAVDKTYNATNRCANVICGSSLKVCRDNGTHAKCECKNGYYQTPGHGQCELDCVPYYCNHRGKCERGPNGRVCRCNQGYSGNRCEKERGVSIPVVVGCSVAAFVLVMFLGVIMCKNAKKGRGRQKKWPLDNDASGENSPASVKAYMNPGANIENDYAIQMDDQNNKKSQLSSFAHAFENKVADESVIKDEPNDNDAEEEDSKL